MAETNTVLFLIGKQGLRFPDSEQLFKDTDNNHAFYLNNSTAWICAHLGIKLTS